MRDPFDDFAAQFFGVYRNRPREIRQTLQSLGSGFLVDPSGYIVTNEHVVERAADLKTEVITNDNKSFKGRYITGDPKKDLAFIKIDSDKLSLHEMTAWFIVALPCTPPICMKSGAAPGFEADAGMPLVVLLTAAAAM